MAKDKTPKQTKTHHKSEAKPNDSFIDIAEDTATYPPITTSAELQEALTKINDNCRQWALDQTEIWKAGMLEHRNSIVNSIQQAIEEKIKPKINKQEKYLINLEQLVVAAPTIFLLWFRSGYRTTHLGLIGKRVAGSSCIASMKHPSRQSKT
jgi:hypothetical protein